ncbi:MAG TPA: hypothetical protein VFM82_09440, partial [Flavobacteriaceae bacterium]|nr:hypothetical protein [Flavobacteriaceae bacterium]
ARLSKVNVAELSPEQKAAYLEQLESIEAEKTRITQEAEKKRLQIRIDSIDREIAKVEEGSERYIELMNERIAIQKDLANLEYGLNTDNLTKGLDKAKDKWKQFANDLRTILTEVFNRVDELQQKAVSRTEKNLDKQEEAVSSQQKRAQEGLSNTLAFEQKQLAERERNVQRQQKKLEQIQKLKAYWNTYNANLRSLNENQDSGDAIVKTLRDMAILEGITASLASFGEGGIVEDQLPKNGVFRGQSHKGNNKGIPIMVEGREGIFSVNEMDNLGRKNFYAIKEAAKRGKLDSNFFGQQHKEFLQTIPVSSDNRNMESKLDRLIDAVRSKETSSTNVGEIIGGFLKITETVKTKNKTIRNHYKIQKPRL